MPRELPRLIVITDWEIPRHQLFERLEAAMSAGPAVAVQHRHPGAPIRTFLEEAQALAELCRIGGNPLFINGRLDVALLVEANLHLPADGILPGDVRPHLPAKAWVSIAVHDPPEAKAASGADIALVSPVFSPGSKPADRRTPLGPDGFRQLALVTPCAAFALGGVTPSNAAQITSAAGLAVISAVLRSEDPGRTARELLDRCSNLASGPAQRGP